MNTGLAGLGHRTEWATRVNVPMAIKEPQSSVLFLNDQGSPLPEWLQKPLRRQITRLGRNFPVLSDLAVIQNILDGVGQRVIEKINSGVEIENLQAYIDAASTNAAVDAAKHSAPFSNKVPLPTAAQELTGGKGARSDAAVLWDRATEVLSGQEEQILIRHLWFGERHQEIGAALGLDVTAVRSRYSRALDKIRSHFRANNTKK